MVVAISSPLWQDHKDPLQEICSLMNALVYVNKDQGIHYRKSIHHAYTHKFFDINNVCLQDDFIAALFGIYVHKLKGNLVEQF